MKNSVSFNKLNEVIKINELKPKSINRGFGYMALAHTPNAKFYIKDSAIVKKAFLALADTHNVWFKTTAKYITVFMEDLDLHRYVLMTIANGKTLKMA